MIPNFKFTKSKMNRLGVVFDLIKKYGVSDKGFGSKKYIDLGCKDGYLLDKAKSLGYSVYGCDISENVIKVLGGQGFDMKKVDLNKALPYSDDYFDVITCLQVIEHLTHPEHLVTEIYRVLKPGGLLVLSTPNLASIGSRIRLLFGLFPLQLSPCENWHFGNHYRLFTVPTLKIVLERNKFNIEKVVGTQLYFNPSSWKKGFCSTYLAKLFPRLAQRVIVVCRKTL